VLRKGEAEKREKGMAERRMREDESGGGVFNETERREVDGGRLMTLWLRSRPCMLVGLALDAQPPSNPVSNAGSSLVACSPEPCPVQS